MDTTQKLGIVGISLGLFSIGYSFYNKAKFEKMLTKNLADGIVLDILDDIVDEAIEIAVNREVAVVVKNIERDISVNTRRDIYGAVKSEVDSVQDQNHLSTISQLKGALI